MDCYQNVKIDQRSCLAPCKGLYADVQKDTEFTNLDEIPKFASILSSYESFKRGFHEDINYQDFPTLKPKKTQLKWIMIYFNTPTFDKIIRDEKANFVTTLSAIISSP